MAIVNKVTGIEIVNIYPNPVRDIAILDIASAKQDNVEVRVMDIAGKVLFTRKVAINSGSTRVPLNLTNLSSGTYVVSIIANGELIKSMKIIKD